MVKRMLTIELICFYLLISLFDEDVTMEDPYDIITQTSEHINLSKRF